MSPWVKYGCALGVALFTAEASADQFHYNNLIVGDRAIGLAGAYTAVADDASGVVYNPAGLAFALSNDISGSANAFYVRSATYKKTIGNSDFNEHSAGSVPSFFGGLQKLDNISPGLAFAFGIYSDDSELKDQDNVIEGGMLDTNTQVGRFHRTVNQRAATNFFGACLGKRITGNIALGIGLNYVQIDELVQDYQDVRLGLAGGTANINLARTQNIRDHLSASGIEPVIGMQMAVGSRLAIGLTYKQSFFISQGLDYKQELSDTYVDDQNNVLTASQVPAALQSKAGKVNRGLLTLDEKKPLGSYPAEARAGAAWFANTRFLWTFDLMHRFAATGGMNPDRYKRLAVTNYASGIEYYLTPSLPVRLGGFTNFDARPVIDKTKAGQPDHVDYYGGTAFLAWVQPNSQIAAGFVVQDGSGEAQKTGTTATQDVTATSATFAFSATHNF